MLAEARDLFLAEAELQALDLGAVVGEGASARVFAAEGAGVASVLKVARDEPSDEILLREARALSLVGGGFAPRLHGVGRWNDRVALLLERAPGRNLRSLLEKLAPEDPSRGRLAWIVLEKGARALEDLHRWGYSHGDIKPENIQVALQPEARLMLIDLGLSTRSECVAGGTPRYLPPQVLRGETTSPFLADAFALSMCVAEILRPVEWKAGMQPKELAEVLPESFARLLAPFLREGETPPSLEWLAEEARRVDVKSEVLLGDVATRQIRREYLAARLLNLEEEHSAGQILLRGLTGTWVKDLVRRLDAIRSCRNRSDKPAPVEPAPISDLTAHDRGRFLGRLVGPVATSWQFEGVEDSQLNDVLAVLGKERSLRSLVYGDVRAALDDERVEPEPKESATDAVSLAFSLGRRPVPRSLLLQVRTGEFPQEIRLEAARAARQMGDFSLAVALLEGAQDAGALLERATIASRSGDRTQAEELRSRALAVAPDGVLKARVLSALARSKLDQGHLEQAEATLRGARPIAPVLEVRALLLLARGEGERALSTAREGALAARTDEEIARLCGVAGMALHFLDRPEEAIVEFSRACEFAGRASSALEEATFATGLSASASDAGRLMEALRASERAELLFESLDMRLQTGRAILARVAILASLGKRSEVLSLASRGLSVSRDAGDSLCEAYLCFAICDVLEGGDERLRFARRAAQLVNNGAVDDRLRATARLLQCGEKPDPAAFEWASSSTSREALADFYGARAAALERISSHAATTETRDAGREIVAQLVALSRSGGRLLSMGPALVSGAHLALRLGLPEEAKELFEEARAIAERLLRSVPSAERANAQSLLWVQQARGSRADHDSSGAQLSDVESLLRALSQRRGFRALLSQTLDLLLLWTNVERGLLLLRAPGDKLVVRAARNLDQRDLSEQQRHLSFSMARRALREGRPIVAVDAVNDVSEMHRSVHALNLRSVLAVPLAARGQILGVAYLDDRIRRGAFGERELSWVGLIGTIAALAIFDERDRLTLERAARRAERAERRLAQQLVEREARLELAERELSRMGGERKLRGDYSQIIGRSAKMVELLQLVDRVSQSDIPALVLGESGTGKELIARAIASSGPRKDEAFVAENCSAVPEPLLESTLFGHKKGAFTGATRDQPGLFELAHRGTLFLDEIGDMPLSMQTKLLRVLQEGEIRPLGSGRPRRVDVRVIVATHKDLKAMVGSGAFREDLYYRLDVVTLRLPPLRERVDDILPLIQYFLEKYSAGNPRTISEPALHRLMQFSWPGNVRQLENEIRRMVVLGGTELLAADLSPEILADSVDAPQARTLKEKVDLLERRLVVEALEQARGNRTRAAEALGLSRFGLQKMIQRLEIPGPKNASKAGRIRDRGLDE